MTEAEQVARYRHLFDYSPATGVLRWRRPTARNVKKWQIAGSNDRWGYRKLIVDGKTMLVHRVIWAIYYGELPKTFLDHINGDRKDNRIINLRLATPSQNAANCHRPHKGGGIRGVSRVKSGKYQASIKGTYLGLYETPEKASEVYVQASLKIYGEFSPFAKRGISQ